MHNNIVLFTVASNNYLVYLERLLASISINLTTAITYVYLINVDERKDEYLKILNKNIIIEHRFIEFKSLIDQKGYCANLRASIFPVIMNKYDCPILWVDVDSLIIREGPELIEYACKFDLSVDYTKNHPLLTASNKKIAKHAKGPFGTPFYGVFNSAIMMTNNSKVAKGFFNVFRDKVNQYSMSWYADQEGLYLTYKEFKNKINFSPLDSKYCSRVYDEKAIIWTAKGNIKENEKYIEQGEKYISNLRKWPMKSPPIQQNKPIVHKTNLQSSIFSRVSNRLKKTIKVLLTGRVG